MAMDFPTSPNPGQTYTYAGITYTWNGYGWIGGALGSAGVIGDAPSDGNEYVRVNGVWRLKEQSFAVNGVTEQVVTVPANAKMALIEGSFMVASSALRYTVLQLSLDGTNWVSGSTDYFSIGSVHWAGTAGQGPVAAVTSPYIVVVDACDNSTISSIFRGQLLIEGLNCQATYQGESRHWYSGAGFGFGFGSNYGYPVAASPHTIKKFKILGNSNQTFTSSKLNVRWVY